MKIGDRIKNRRKQLGLSVDQVADKLGKNRATVYRYESSEIEKMPIDIIENLANALQTTPAFLMGWEDQNNDKSLQTKTPSNDYWFYEYGISAGMPGLADGVTHLDKIILPDILMGKYAGDTRLLITRANGESMNKIIPNHSYMALKSIDSVRDLKDGDIVVYSHQNEFSVKHFYRVNDKVIFKPNSNDVRYTDYIVAIRDPELIIHGKVVMYLVEND